MKNFPLKVLSYLLVAFSLLLVNRSYAQKIYALSGNNLIALDATVPGTVLQSVQITGLAAGYSLVGLDFRPVTGQLYALGYHAISGAAELYTIDRNTAAATKVGAASLMLNPNVADFGFDFNPTVDRIRVTGSDNSNYRIHPVTGALADTDGNLSYATSDANAASDPNVVTSAYTNSYIGATSTTLFNMDASLNILATQVPPNNGTLNTIGGTGLNLNINNPSLDLDIAFDVATASNMAYLVANTGTSVTSELYSINLNTGAAAMIGSVGSGLSVRDIAIFIDRTVPATITGNLIYALNAGGNLISFDANLPGVVRTLVGITGISAGQVISGLDSRPATGELYALGYNATIGETRLYTINPATGAATAMGNAPVMLAAGMGKIGMDFNPTVDRIRVTGSNNANYRFHPVTGAIAATDMNLAFVGTNAGINPSIGAVAYTNSFNGAGTTTLYNYDDSLNVLTTQIPPNNGVLNTIGSSGIAVNLLDPSTDLDIFYDQATAQNTAYLAANIGTQTSDNLYTVNLATGLVTLVGKIGLGIAITDLAAAITVAPEEIACDENTAGCTRFELISVRRDAAGDEIYRIRVTNTCASPLTYVAFTVPDGMEAVSPANGGTYLSPSTRPYAVRSPNFSPFYSIRFKTLGVGIANGQSDIFEYKLPKQADLTNINAFVRLADGTGTEVYLSTFNCPTQPSNASRMEAPITDRTEEKRFKSDNMDVFPNPSAGQIWVDLSAWSGQTVQMTVMTATAQRMQLVTATANDIALLIDLPVSLANGLYYLEMRAADGTSQVKRIVVQR